VDGLEGDGGVVVSWVGGLLKGWLFRSLRDFSYGSLFFGRRSKEFKTVIRMNSFSESVRAWTSHLNGR
jgi:hypothetical protein